MRAEKAQTQMRSMRCRKPPENASHRSERKVI